MTKDEALAFDLALEALKLSSVTVDSFGVQRKIQEAITALKKVRALDKMAENARELGLDYEPVAPVREDWGPGPHECHSLTAASVQEPSGFFRHEDVCGDEVGPPTPYYLAPPNVATPLAAQRQSARSAWVGLTDEDREDAWRNALHEAAIGESTATKCFARAIEAKLKEKNT